MKQIRILLAGMPPLLRDIVREAIANQPDMDLQEHPGEGDALIQSLSKAARDVVIVGAGQPDDFTLAHQLLQASSGIKVLVVANSGRSAIIYEMRPHQVLLGDVSPETLVAAIRDFGTESSIFQKGAPP